MKLPESISRRAASVSAKYEPSIFDDPNSIGIALAPTPLYHYSSEAREGSEKTTEDLYAELRRQRHDIQTLPGKALIRGIDEMGRLNSEPSLRLTEAAFADLCTSFKIPLSFIRDYARLNTGRAVSVINDYILGHRDSLSETRDAVVDVGDGTVQGIVGTHTYSRIDNLNVLGQVLAAASDMQISRAMIQGARVRFTAIRAGEAKEVQKGDIVRFGYDADNSINGNSSLRVSGYFERLVCLNGAVRRDSAMSYEIPHRGDIIDERLGSAIVSIRDQTDDTMAMAKLAAQTTLSESERQLVRTFVSTPKLGGSKRLADQIETNALREALDEGRDENETTLWNYVNAATWLSHSATSIRRGAEFETLGASMLRVLGDKFYARN